MIDTTSEIESLRERIAELESQLEDARSENHDDCGDSCDCYDRGYDEGEQYAKDNIYDWHECDHDSCYSSDAVQEGYIDRDELCSSSGYGRYLCGDGDLKAFLENHSCDDWECESHGTRGDTVGQADEANATLEVARAAKAFLDAEDAEYAMAMKRLREAAANWRE